MDDDTAKWLFDAHQACWRISEFVSGKSFGDFRSDRLLSSAVERQFEIMGEALKRIRDQDEDFLEGIHGWRGAISFRNILAHGYDEIDPELVWGIIEDDLPILINEIEKMLKQEPEHGHGPDMDGFDEGRA